MQLRARSGGSDDLALFAVALRLREMTTGSVPFVVTGDLELAERCHADGVLLFERTYKPSDARGFLRAEGAKTVGVFTRNVPSAAKAERGGADYVQIGPIFDTTTTDPAPDSGLALLRKVKDAVQVPVVAFGGIDSAERAVDCIQAGADGVAVTDLIRSAPEPGIATTALRAAIDAAWRVLHPKP